MSEETTPQPAAAPEAAPPAMKSVDIFGVSIDVPESKAQELIRVRDEKVQAYNEVIGERERAAMEASEAKRRAEALEAAKNEDTAKAEELFAQRYKEQITKYENHSYRSAVRAALAERKDLVDGAIDDAS
jgi:hypothetical protein